MLLFYKLTVRKKNTAARRLCQEGENRKSIHFLRRCIAFARGFWYDTIELKGDFGRMTDGKGFDRGSRGSRTDGGGCCRAAGTSGNGAGAYREARAEDPCHRQGALQRDQRLPGRGIFAPCAHEPALFVLLAGGVPPGKDHGAVRRPWRGAKGGARPPGVPGIG